MRHEPQDDADWLLFELGGKHRAQVLSTLAATRLPDRIAELGSATVAQLAHALAGDDAQASIAADLDSLLRAAAGLGCLREEPPGTFALTPRGEQLCSDALGAFAAYLGSKSQWDPWSRFRDSLAGADGATPFRRAFGQDLYPYLREHPGAAAEYDAAIDAFTKHEARLLRERLDLCDRQLLVDVGGGRGALLRELLPLVPAARGVLFDLAPVIDAVRSDLPDRVEAVAGDFFDAVPDGADVYLIKHVLHNWDDARALQLLRNCHDAMAPGGIVVVIDAILAPDNRPDLARMLDLEMRVLCGGRERRKPEVRRLLADAGLNVQLAEELNQASWLFVAGKP